jgi:hypothetical protein
MRASSLILGLSSLCCSCVGSTGEDLVSFAAVASGPSVATGATGTLHLDTGRGYSVDLTTAKLHIGAVYLNRARPTSGAGETSCTLPGIYVAQLTQGMDVDLLSANPTLFPAAGEGTASHALAGEVWLTGGVIDASEDTTPILVVAGTAHKQGVDYPFEGTITIGSNRDIPSPDPSQPGANPICKQRIVTPIPVDLTPAASGRLHLTIDPTNLFGDVNFKDLDVDPKTGVRAFADDASNAPSRALYDGLRAHEGVYSFTWEP